MCDISIVTRSFAHGLPVDTTMIMTKPPYSTLPPTPPLAATDLTDTRVRYRHPLKSFHYLPKSFMLKPPRLFFSFAIDFHFARNPPNRAASSKRTLDRHDHAKAAQAPGRGRRRAQI